MGEVKERKTHIEILECLRKLRACYPESEVLYIVQDNLSSHKHEKVQSYMDDNLMVPVWLPTYSSWLNLIESHFGILKKFVIRNSNYVSKGEQTQAIYDYIVYRNQEHNAHECTLTNLLKT